MRGGRSCCERMMHLPNKSMRPSAASRKENVSTPSGDIGTFSNDCCSDVVVDWHNTGTEKATTDLDRLELRRHMWTGRKGRGGACFCRCDCLEGW